jgi:predicted nucleic acid-binding protein
MQRRSLVLDANILLRAVFGASVLPFMTRFADSVAFSTPDVCLTETLKHIPVVSLRRGVQVDDGFELFEEVVKMIEVVELVFYSQYEVAARRRIAARDPNDWPILATALLLDCPIWTEDQDFFGTGVATWTTNNVEIYLGDA